MENITNGYEARSQQSTKVHREVPESQVGGEKSTTKYLLCFLKFIYFESERECE